MRIPAPEKNRESCAAAVVVVFMSDLTVASKLLSIGLLERDKHDDVFFTWQYPSIDDNLRELITDVVAIHNDASPKYIYLK